MVNASAAPPVNVPAVIVTVNTPAAEIVEVPAPPAPPVVNVRVPGEATASPDPLSVMMILPVAGIVAAGVRVTVMVTPVAPLAGLLRVTAGCAAPSGSIIATKVPVLLAPIITPALSVVAATMVVDAT